MEEPAPPRRLRQRLGHDEENEEALVEAAASGDLELVCHFVEETDTNVNATDDDGGSALLWAAENGHIHVVRYLTEQNARVNARDNQGTIALMRAAGYGRTEVVRYLVECGAKVDIIDRYG